MLDLRHKPLWLAGAVVGGLIAVAVWNDHPAVSGAAPRWQTATRGVVEKTITATGAIKPKTYVDVGTQVSGQLRRIHVQIGARVVAGQLLAEIDPTVYRTRVAADQARIKDLEAQLRERRADRELADIRYNRQLSLEKNRVTSRELVDAAKAEALAAAARVDQVAAKLDEARATLQGDEANLGYTQIFAPISGTVVDISATEGQTLNASQTAPTITRIADLDTMTVWAQVAEADVPHLREGLSAYFSTLGEPGQRWPVRVRQILPTPTVINDVVLYSVLADVANPEGRLMSEMTAQVFFIEDRAEDVVVVPRGVVVADTGGKTAKTRVATANGDDVRSLEIGLMTRTQVEVKSGLQPGDKVAPPPMPRGGK